MTGSFSSAPDRSGKSKRTPIETSVWNLKTIYRVGARGGGGGGGGGEKQGLGPRNDALTTCKAIR